jgi:hypothetical protein
MMKLFLIASITIASFIALPAMGLTTLTKTKSKIYIKGLPVKAKTEISIQVRKPISIRVDECGNGKISTGIAPVLIEVNGKTIPVSSLPIIEKSICGKSGQIKGEKNSGGKMQNIIIISSLPPKKSLPVQLIVNQKKKIKANKCGIASIERKQRLLGYAEKYIETVYSVNGKTLNAISDQKEPESNQCKSVQIDAK